MSVSQQLLHIDKEIELRRQQINVLTLEIAKLEDHRRTTLWLEEQRLGQVPGVVLTDRQRELLSGKSERPLLIMRDASQDDGKEEGRRDYKSEYRRRMQAKGLTAGGKPRKRPLDKLPVNMIKRDDGSIGPRVRAVRSDKGKNKNNAEARALNEIMRNRILTSMEHRAEPVTNGELIESFGITEPSEKGRVYNAMQALKKAGAVVDSGNYSYRLARGNGHAL